MKIQMIVKVVILTTFSVVIASYNTATAQSPAGTWQLYPAQANVYTTSVQQPINADGTSNFKSTGKSVIPVQFSLSVAPGPAIFQSIYSDGTDSNPSTTNDYSFLSFTPASTLLFNQITNLTATYAFTTGNCHGGALRWSVRVLVQFSIQATLLLGTRAPSPAARRRREASKYPTERYQNHFSRFALKCGRGRPRSQ